MNKTSRIDILSMRQRCRGVLSFAPQKSRAVGSQATLGNLHLQERSTGEKQVLQEASQGASDAFVGGISNYSMFESHHFLDSANQRYVCPGGQNTSFYFLLHN